ncbi:hypothetical protein GOP47_0024849 [Adiantum capillus-veneris]|uniref:EXPERA domain-containing protein n=1 Tax=Adiantum capillus-veneris TaxID=13818 RepID=A0A9D4Z408_ADICA|nr:hypothetical protein GOP47_0024849 [Adiantum capillus-veneris]
MRTGRPSELLLSSNPGTVVEMAILPAHIYPRFLRSLLSWYISFSGDYLVRDTPPFFKGLVVAEIFFQLPLIIVNAYAFYQGKRWARTTGLIYGVHTTTTMVPILADLLCSRVASKSTLMAFYVPYLMIPLALTFHVLTPYSDLRPLHGKLAYDVERSVFELGPCEPMCEHPKAEMYFTGWTDIDLLYVETTHHYFQSNDNDNHASLNSMLMEENL